MAFPCPEDFIEEGGSRRQIDGCARVLTRPEALWGLDARLDHHESAQGRDQAVGFDGTIDPQRHLLQACTVKDWHSRIHVLEKEIDADIDHVRAEQPWRPGEGGRHG